MFGVDVAVKALFLYLVHLRVIEFQDRNIFVTDVSFLGFHAFSLCINDRLRSFRSYSNLMLNLNFLR